MKQFSFCRSPHTECFIYLMLSIVCCCISTIAYSSTEYDIYASESGDFYLSHPQSPSQHEPALHVKSQAFVEINGLIASVELKQTFVNPTNNWLEGVYVFPLQEKAAVSYMSMLIGDRTIISEIKEKTVAKKIYEQAKAEGKKAALTTQERPNIFTQKVANIAPGETISITLRMKHSVDYNHGQFEYKLPMTITPRYNPGTTIDIAHNNEPPHTQDHSEKLVTAQGWGVPTHSVPDADRITPPYHPPFKADQGMNPISLNILLNAGIPLAEISSRYHDIHISKKDQKHWITTNTQTINMDRDFILTWTPIANALPLAAYFHERVKGEDYGMVMVMPPTLNPETEPARDVIFIIDTSGSMSGASIRQAKQSLKLAIERLSLKDQFNIVEFNSSTASFFSSPIPATNRNKNIAIEKVMSLKANGGTEMKPALKAAFHQMAGAEQLKQIIFITDGSVGNEQELLEFIHLELGDSRLFTVSIGSSPNHFFMRKAAQFGRGTHTHIGDLSEVREEMNHLFGKLESAVLTDININWPSEVEMWPKHLPDLYLDDPLIIAVKYRTPMEMSQLQITGTFSDQQNWLQNIELQTPSTTSKNENTPNDKALHKGIATLWARAKIEHLMDEKTRGRAESEVRQAVLNVALTHHLVSAYTSLVAVEETISNESSVTSKSVNVPLVKPHGQQSIAYPQTATSQQVLAIIGILGLCIVLLLRLMDKAKRTVK